LWITLFWTIIGVLQILFEDAFLIEHNVISDLRLDWLYWKQLISNIISYFLIGFVGGTTIIFFLQPWFRSQAYGRALLYVALTYTVLFILLTFVQMFILIALNVEVNRIYPEFILSIKRYFLSTIFIKYYVFWLLVVIATLVGLFVSDKYGPGVLTKLLLGKYFNPKEENRIFMFLDLKGSTTIAEQLGERQYFHFLKETFSDVTKLILETKGEIYQYVGDEIIISWTYPKGLQELNCIRCFFEINHLLEEKSESYLDKFGARPIFKAGIHCGNVIAGEIGIIKKDITFSGDVLNTTARIQSKCNEYGSQCLVSEDLIELIDDNNKEFRRTKVGDVSLRGKDNPVLLYSMT
jgi:adenylate cyclase